MGELPCQNGGIFSWKKGTNPIIYTPCRLKNNQLEVRMISLTKQLKRREFLQKGIAGGVMIAAFPLQGSNSKKFINSSDESHDKLLKILHSYGGEFGSTRGGL
jgi:hypothetical protein